MFGRAMSWMNMDRAATLPNRLEQARPILEVVRLASGLDAIEAAMPRERGTTEPQGASSAPGVSTSEGTDWSDVIDTINELGRAAKDHDAQLLSHQMRQSQIIDKLRKDLQEAEQRANSAEARACEEKVRAETRLVELEERAAQQLRACEARCRVSETRIEDLGTHLNQLQAQLRAACARVREFEIEEANTFELLDQAKALVALIEARAAEQVSVAQREARAANQRAEIAEDWLRRIEIATGDLLQEPLCVAA